MNKKEAEKTIKLVKKLYYHMIEIKYNCFLRVQLLDWLSMYDPDKISENKKQLDDE